MKNLLKHIKFLISLLMMLVLLPACSSTSSGTAEEAQAYGSVYGAECRDECEARSCDDPGTYACKELCSRLCTP